MFFFGLGILLFGEEYTLLINVGCFIVAASFAYVTNKLFVFDSKSWDWTVLRKEIPAFFSARILSVFGGSRALDLQGSAACRALQSVWNQWNPDCQNCTFIFGCTAELRVQQAVCF